MKFREPVKEDILFSDLYLTLIGKGCIKNRQVASIFWTRVPLGGGVASWFLDALKYVRYLRSSVDNAPRNVHPASSEFLRYALLGLLDETSKIMCPVVPTRRVYTPVKQRNSR